MLNTPKTSVNLYLDYPKHIYYETVIRPDKDTPNSIIVPMFQRLYPLHLYSHSTPNPEFVHMRDGATLDPDKTFAQNGITNNDGTPEIRIRLKIHRLLKQSSMK
jgi:hypothetical protein